MTVTIADLVARIRADTSGLQQGAQQATQQLQGVQQQAEQTARALQIMAEQSAKIGGGTSQGWLEMFQRANVQPTAAALTQAAQEAQKTAAAVAQSVAPTQAAARAAQDHAAAARTGAVAATNVADGWKMSESSLVRFGAGLAGISLGISLVAGAARLVHDVIVSTVDAQLDWERSLKNISGLYGQAGASAAALATAQANLPGVLGTQQEFAQAGINASALRLRYGLPQQTVDQLTTTGGRVAYATGMTDQTQRSALQQQILQAVQTGAPLPPQYGVYTDAEAVARRLGFSGAQSLQAFTPQEAMQARGAIVSEGLNAFADRANANQRAALDALTAATKVQTEAQSNLQTALERVGGPVGVFGNAQVGVSELGQYYERSTGQPIDPQTGLPLTGALGPQTAAAGPSANLPGLAAIDAEQNVIQANQRYAVALADSTKAQDDARKTIDALAHSADAAGAQLLHFFGSLEDQTSIAHADILAQAQAAVTTRARSALPERAMTDQEIQAIARGTAAQDAYRNYVAPLAQQEQTNAIQRYLQQQATTQGPGLEAQRGAAQAALAELPRREQAQTVIGTANRAADLTNRASTEAQAQLDAIQLRSDERHLAVAQELAGYRREVLGVESQLAPILLNEATLQDRMVVAARDSLQSRRELIAAQQDELRTTQITSAYDYEQQRLALRAEQSRATVRQGGAPTEDISALREQYRALELQRAASGADITALDASRRTQVVQQQRTAEQLARDERLTALDEQYRRLQDQQIPLEQNLRSTQAQTDLIQRQVELLDLQDTNERTAAQLRQNAANQLHLVIDEIARQADDYANGLDLGATAAERSQAALEKARDAIKETVPLLAGLQAGSSDLGGKLANGLGAGGLGPTRGGPPGFSVVIEAGQSPEQFKTQVHIAVEDALNNFFAGASTAGSPAPGSVAGAGR